MQLARQLGGASAFVGEGIAYWLGGAGGQRVPATMHDHATVLAPQTAPGLRETPAADAAWRAGVPSYADAASR